MSLEFESPQPTPRRLADQLSPALTPEQTAWLQQALDKLRGLAAPDHDMLALLSAQAGRKLDESILGDHATPLSGGDGTPVPLANWTQKTAGRVLLWSLAESQFPDDAQEIVRNGYRSGDESERRAVTQGLCLLSCAADLQGLAHETGRANSLPLFSSLALDNPFPASHYSDHDFNQMILKALFLGVPVSGVIGLDRRANPELSRMCEDYFDERLAAGRTLPQDGWLALAPHASKRGEQMLLEHLEHAETGHRYYAAIATGMRATKHPDLCRHLEARLTAEQEPAVIDLLQSMITA